MSIIAYVLDLNNSLNIAQALQQFVPKTIIWSLGLKYQAVPAIFSVCY